MVNDLDQRETKILLPCVVRKLTDSNKGFALLGAPLFSDDALALRCRLVLYLLYGVAF